MSASTLVVRTHPVLRAAVLVTAFALTACPAPGGTPDADAGTPPPDLCNSIEEALSNPQCELASGKPLQGFVHPPGADQTADQDWYSFRVPANANPRTLIHLRGGYAAPMTAVNLSLNLLEEDGQTSLVRKSDRHGQAAPKPVDIVLPFEQANARLLVLVTDDAVNPSRPGSDLRNPYELTVEVLEDPDANEPNDTTATAIPLAAQNGALVGTQTGWLSTADDLDLFEFDVPANKVLYLRVTAPQVAPPPPFRLKYVLMDPAGDPKSEGMAQNEYIAVDLATARRVWSEGKWKVKIEGCKDTRCTEPVEGNLDLKYTVDIRLFDEADPNELTSDNNRLENATLIPLGSVGQTQSKTGRIGYMADPDWYAVTLAASAAPTVLHYRLRVSDTPGRFEPLAPVGARELRVLRHVQTGGTAQQDVNACKTDDAICPKSGNDDVVVEGLIQEQCQNFSPPRCLWSRRTEHPEFEKLRNFEGTLPIAPHGSAVTVYFLVQDDGTNWADDRDYTLEVTRRADADEAGRLSGGVEQTVGATLAQDTQNSYPYPPPGATALTGTLSHGPGFFRRHNANNGDGVKSYSDYDAVVSDIDTYQIALPALPAAGEPLDLAWELQWEIAHLPDGRVPSDLAIELEFCDGSNPAGGVCRPVKRSSEGQPLVVGYSGSPVWAWHNVDQPASARQSMYEQQVSATSTTVTASPYGCFCIEPRFRQGGHFKMTVLAVDRDDYAATPYTIRTAWTTYPQSYTAADGTTQSCPAPGPDAGCVFTR
ncbi:MAG: hypothetical protein WBV82_12765 [Myxococcaceae bacterium]